MLILFNMNWAGTRDDLREMVERLRKISEEIDGLNFKDIFYSSSRWTFTILFDAVSYDKCLEAYGTYQKKYGPAPVSGQSWTILHPFEELGVPPLY